MGLDLHNYAVVIDQETFLGASGPITTLVLEHRGSGDGEVCLLSVSEASIPLSGLLALATQHNAEAHS